MSELTDDTYQTVASTSEGLYKEKGSRFLSFVYPVTSVEAVKSIVEDKRKLYHDARHVCYAYRVGYNGEDFRQNDDGEPSGTAGRPMYGCLLSHNLVNVLVVVVRYFGGVKLGVSGLANAYKQATEDALMHNEVQERTVDIEVEVTFDYLYLNEVMRIVKEMKPEIQRQQFEMSCRLSLSIRQRRVEALRTRLSQVPTLLFEN
jgi:uncharacterized YigZ family protein